MSDYLYENKDDIISDVNFKVSKDAFGFFIQIDHFKIMKQNINDFGIEYTPIIEIVLPGINKKYEFSPFDNLYSNENITDAEKGRLQLKKINKSHLSNSSNRKDYKIFLTKIVSQFLI